ncbi:hypothetical protein [Streptomyces sp. NPDC017964]|uniref:hypothetical protein n=1 Tax=Streptomyces sp. NPDC017964 TaxID=3365022 RepID=UPI003791A1FB
MAVAYGAAYTDAAMFCSSLGDAVEGVSAFREKLPLLAQPAADMPPFYGGWIASTAS